MGSYRDFNKAEYSGFKAALTRATKAKDWTKVLAVVARVEAVFNAPNAPPWPDDWSMWERAKDDATFALRRAATW
jgi:hypothetical protein